GEEQRSRQRVSVNDRRVGIQGVITLHRGIGWGVVSGMTGERIPGPVVGTRLRQIHWVSEVAENAGLEGCCGYGRDVRKGSAETLQLVVEKEECLILAHGAADGVAELVTDVGVLWAGIGPVEPVPRPS